MNPRTAEILSRRMSQIEQTHAARDEAADRNRARFPKVSALLDELKRECPDPKGHRVKFAAEGNERAGRAGLLPGEIAVNARDIVLDHLPGKPFFPDRVRKGKPATKERWYSESEES